VWCSDQRGKVVKCQGIKLTTGDSIDELHKSGYKYLGVIETDKVDERKYSQGIS